MITHGEKWGAGRAASRLLNCFEQNNFEVKLLLAKKERNSANLIELKFLSRIAILFLSRFDKFVCNLLEPRNYNWKSAAFFGSLGAKALNTSNFDIINIHWIGHGLISLRQLIKINKPIIFTVNDEWLLNSISHYYHEIDIKKTFINGLRNRILNSRLKVKNSLILRKNVVIVSVSEEIAKKFKQRFPQKLDKIFVIPNPIDTNIFYPDINKSIEVNGRSIDKPYAFFIGGTKDDRKGWDLLEKSIQLCNEKFTILAVGAQTKKGIGKNSQIDIVGIENISELTKLRSFYSNAKLTVVPSRAEALPQVATESISCGTPVVGFQIGGLEDIIIKSKTGILVPKFDIDKFALAIDEVIAADKTMYTRHCRAYSQTYLSYGAIAQKYKSIFNILI
ncbi:MAG: glycosyltransferase [Alphaproteobacteria bacterium]|nr:glycosyltransferase [Alphaproteobacteria bacterium]